MRQVYQKCLYVAGAVAIALFIPSRVVAQDSPRDKHLSLTSGVGTVTEQGEIGGESQARYTLQLEAGRKITVTLFSQQNKAEFGICDERDGFGDSEACQGGKIIKLKRPGKFGKARHRTAAYWSGLIPQTGSYTITVTAYPGSARYTLQIKVER